MAEIMFERVKYAYSELKRNYARPGWLSERMQHHVNSRFQRRIYPQYNGVHIYDEDWDNLIILDACRYDLFEQASSLDQFDEYSTKTSLGSTTEEWMQNNFGSSLYSDTVYVTANPYPSKVGGDRFCDMVHVWEESFDDEYGVVYPESIYDAAIEAFETYPHKRIIIHFIQPHYPFIGSDGYIGGGNNVEMVLSDKDGGDRLTPWKELRLKKISRETIWSAYRDNLEYVLPYAIDLAEELGGKSIVTSDHGNMIGERGWPMPLKTYGHPGHLRYEPLIRVPWAVFNHPPRREIEEGRIRDRSVTNSNSAVSDRLRDLGYLE